MGAVLLRDLKAEAQTLSHPGTQAQTPPGCSAASGCLLPALQVSRVPRTPQIPASSHGQYLSASKPWDHCSPPIPAHARGRELLQPRHVLRPLLSPAAPLLPCSRRDAIPSPSPRSSPSFCPFPAPWCEGNPSLTRQGRELLAGAAVCYSKRGIRRVRRQQVGWLSGRLGCLGRLHSPGVPGALPGLCRVPGARTAPQLPELAWLFSPPRCRPARLGAGRGGAVGVRVGFESKQDRDTGGCPCPVTRCLSLSPL